MPEAVIVDAVRTPIGRAFKGSLAQLRPDEMGAFVVDALLERNPASTRPDRGGLLRRRPAPGPPGLQHRPHHRAALRAPPLGDERRDDVALLRLLARVDPPGGERRGRGPGRRLHRGRRGVGLALQRGGRGSPPAGPERAPPGQERRPDAYISMGLTAENVAERYEVSRADMDKYAQRSQELAVASQENGYFDREIVPVTLPDGTVVAKDDGPRAARRSRSSPSSTRLQGGRQGHRRQLLPAQRRRRRGARDVGSQGRRARPEAARRIITSPRRRTSPSTWASPRSGRSARCSSAPA